MCYTDCALNDPNADLLSATVAGVDGEASGDEKDY